jgi:hypothetical protein
MHHVSDLAILTSGQPAKRDECGVIEANLDAVDSLRVVGHQIEDLKPVAFWLRRVEVAPRLRGKTPLFTASDEVNARSPDEYREK